MVLHYSLDADADAVYDDTAVCQSTSTKLVQQQWSSLPSRPTRNRPSEKVDRVGVRMRYPQHDSDAEKERKTWNALERLASVTVASFFWVGGVAETILCAIFFCTFFFSFGRTGQEAGIRN